MPRIQDSIVVQGRFFSWRLYQREGIYYADGRGRNPGVALKRYSLDCTDQTTARVQLNKLDEKLAIKHGRARAEDVAPGALTISVDEGVRLFLEHCQRSDVTRGLRSGTIDRYRVLLDNITCFLHQKGIRDWGQVTDDVAERFARERRDQDKAANTVASELAMMKQVVRHLVRKVKRLPPTALLTVEIRRPQETSAYCPTMEEVAVLIRHCRSDASLQWMADALELLSRTGMRISEMINLRWTDISADLMSITLTDDASKGLSVAQPGQAIRSTKGRRSRTLPVHPTELAALLARMREHQQPDGLVFHGPKGDKINAIYFRHVLNTRVLPAVLKQLPVVPEGMPSMADFTPHSLRHYFCSCCANQGVPMLAVQNWLGHADSKIVKRYYHQNAQEAVELIKPVRFVPTSSLLLSSPLASSSPGVLPDASNA